MRQRQITTLGIMGPVICNKCVGSLMSPANHVALKMQETWPTFYSPYLRRIESSVILTTGVLVWSLNLKIIVT